MVRSISPTGIWEVKNKRYYEEYNLQCNPVKRRYFEQKEQSRILGEATIGATIKIIEYFKPKYWVIENPQTSKTWLFQKYHWNFKGYENLAYYACYDQNFSKKPTIFKSNVKLQLIAKPVKGNYGHMAYGSYSKRSSIPERLIKSILEQLHD